MKLSSKVLIIYSLLPPSGFHRCWTFSWRVNSLWPGNAVPVTDLDYHICSDEHWCLVGTKTFGQTKCQKTIRYISEWNFDENVNIWKLDFETNAFFIQASCNEISHKDIQHTLVYSLEWYMLRTTPSHYLNQCWRTFIHLGAISQEIPQP